MWIQLEQDQSPVPLKRAPWCYDFLPNKVKSHPLIGQTARVCPLLLKKGSLSSETSPISPILGNSLFTPGYKEEPFKHLLHSEYEQASHFLIQGKWPSLLMDPEGPFRLKFWNALQLSHFLRTLPPSSNFDQPLTTLEEICATEGTLPHMLSSMYNLLITPSDPHLSFIADWERDLNRTFSPQQKQRMPMWGFG